MINWFNKLGGWLGGKLERQAAARSLSITLILLLTLGALSFIITRGMLLRSINQQLEHEATIVAQQIEIELDQITNAGFNLSTNPLIRNALVDSAGRGAYLMPFLQKYRISQLIEVQVLLADFSGKIVAANSEGVGNITDPWLSSVVDMNKAWAEISSVDDVPWLVLAWPVVYPATQMPEGALVVRLRLAELFRRNLPSPELETVKELRSNDQAVFRTDSSLPGAILAATKPLPQESPLDRMGLELVLWTNSDKLTSAMQVLVLAYVLAGIVAIILTTMFSITNSRRLVAPLVELSQVATQVSQSGRFDFQLSTERRDEVGVLAKVFSEMLAQLSVKHEEMEALISERTRRLADSESRMRAVLETAMDGILIIDAAGIIASINPAGEQIFGYGAGELLGQNLTVLMAEPHRSQHRNYVANYLQKHLGQMTNFHQEVSGLHRDGLAIAIDLSVSKIQLGDELFFTGIFRDITQRRRQEQEIRQLSLVAQYTDNAVAITDAQGRVQWINEAYNRIFDYPSEDVAGRTPWELLSGAETDTTAVEWIAAQLAKGHGFDTEVLLYARHGQSYWLSIEGRPIANARGQIINFIVLQKDITQRRRDEEALRRARDREVAIGAHIQQVLLLGAPPRNFPGVKVDVYSFASQRIDGDFYDFIKLGDQVLDVVVGDVMGKGVPAALVGAATKAHFARAFIDLRASRESALPEPREVLGRVNHRVANDLMTLESFATLSYARFDLGAKTVTYVDCGHPGILHYHQQSGSINTLKGENMPLGFRLREEYVQSSVPVGPGDMFLFYSDGVTEARDRQGGLFGEPRLLELFAGHKEAEPSELLSVLYQAVEEFTGHRSLGDDLTMVAIKIGEDETQTASLLHEEREFRSNLSALSAMRQFVNEFWDRNDPLPGEADALAGFVLALNEAASNVIKHAYGGVESQPVWISLDLHARGIEARISHLGAAFDGKAPQPPAFDGSRESGFGLYLIDQLVDEHQYLRDERGRQCVRLAKWRKEQPVNGTTS